MISDMKGEKGGGWGEGGRGRGNKRREVCKKQTAVVVGGGEREGGREAHSRRRGSFEQREF